MALPAPDQSPVQQNPPLAYTMLSWGSLSIEVIGMADEVRTSDDPVAGTTWAFLRPGWWILHVVAIVGVFWLGSVLWQR